MILPQGWVATKLGNYIFVRNGYAFKSKDYVKIPLGTYPVIRISDLDGEIASSIASVRIQYEVAVDGFELEKGDLLIAMSGATTGKLGIYNGEVPAYQNQRVGNIKLLSTTYGSKEFRNFLLRSLFKQIFDKAYGGAQPNISAKGITDLPILLPPLNEQKRIAEKLEQLLARVDKVKEKLEGVGEHIIKLKLSILTQATYGKLVGKGVYKDWQQFTFEEICTKITDGTHHSPKSYEHGKYEYVTAKNIRPWGLDLSNITYVEQDVYATIYKRCPVEKGDVLYIKDGATTGLAIVNPLERPFAMLSSVALLKPKHDVVLGPFLAMVLNSPWFKQRALGKMSGSAIRRLVLRQIKAFEIYLPPLEEQHEIVHRVEHLLTLADTLEQHYQQAKQKVDKLTAAILAKAFRGELVPQDPNDEPAEKLLERIQAERQAQQEKEKAAKKVKRKRKKAL